MSKFARCAALLDASERRWPLMDLGKKPAVVLLIEWIMGDVVVHACAWV